MSVYAAEEDLLQQLAFLHVTHEDIEISNKKSGDLAATVAITSDIPVTIVAITLTKNKKLELTQFTVKQNVKTWQITYPRKEQEQILLIYAIPKVQKLFTKPTLSSKGLKQFRKLLPQSIIDGKPHLFGNMKIYQIFVKDLKKFKSKKIF